MYWGCVSTAKSEGNAENTVSDGSSASERPSDRSHAKGCLFILLGAVVLCIAAAIVVNLSIDGFFRAIVVGKTGPVSSPRDWPQPLKDLVTDAARAKIDIKGLQVHQMNDGFDPEYIWQMKATAGLFDLIAARWKLSPTPVPDRGVFCGKSQFSGDSTPDWWSPEENAETQFYACENALAGEKGNLFQVAVDKKRGIIFVQYHYNF